MENKDKILVDYLDKYRDLAFSKSNGLSMQRGSNLTVEDIILIHVKRVTFEDEAPRKEAIENVLSSMRLKGVNFLYIIRGCKDHVEFYYGIVRNTIIKGSVNGEDNIKESILKKSIEGNFRGSDVELVDEQKTNAILTELRNKRFVSCIDGVPGINKDEAANFQGVDRLVDTMLGEDFLFVVSAFYLNQGIIDHLKTNVCSFYDQMTPLAKNTEQRGSSEGYSKSTGKTVGTNESKSDSRSNSDSKGFTKSTTTSQTKSKSNIQESGTEGSSNSEQSSSSHTEQQSSGLSKSESSTEGNNTGKSTTFSFERSKKNVQDWMAYAEDFLLKRLDYGQGKGLFMTNIYLSSG